jgi:hypothetical protein
MADASAFDATHEAAKMRAEATLEVHQNPPVDNGPQSLLGLFGDLKSDPQHLNAVANALEQGNSAVSFAPQAAIERYKGDVVSITFRPGSLDFSANPRIIEVGKLGHMGKEQLDR